MLAVDARARGQLKQEHVEIEEINPAPTTTTNVLCGQREKERTEHKIDKLQRGMEFHENFSSSGITFVFQLPRLLRCCRIESFVNVET